MAILGNITGGRYTKIKRVTFTGSDSGTGSAAYVPYTCPANTTARISIPAWSSTATETIFSVRFEIIDGVTGVATNVTSTISFLNTLPAVFRRTGWIPQLVSNASTPASITYPYADVGDISSSSPANSNDFYNMSRFDFATNQIILRQGDSLRHSIGSHSGSARAMTYILDVEEETR